MATRFEFSLDRSSMGGGHYIYRPMLTVERQGNKESIDLSAFTRKEDEGEKMLRDLVKQLRDNCDAFLSQT